MRAITAVATVLIVLSLVAARPRHIELRMRVPPGLAAGISGGAAVWALASALGAPGSIAFSAALLVIPAPMSLRSGAARRARNRSASRWPDFLAAVRSRIATGASLPEATRAAARHLGGRFLELDRGALEPYESSLRRARLRWSDPISDRVLITLAVAADVGGRHVDAVLNALATSVADELRLRQAHDAALTQQRLTAGIALIAPWAMLALSVATNPAAADAFAEPAGTWIVTGGLAATVAGFVLSRHSARLSEPPRVFA